MLSASFILDIKIYFEIYFFRTCISKCNYLSVICQGALSHIPIQKNLEFEKMFFMFRINTFVHKNEIFFISASRWHRIGLSVKGTQVSLVFDCEVSASKFLNRTIGGRIDTMGMVFLARDLTAESTDSYFFEVR